jgi:hypothetical protein
LGFSRAQELASSGSSRLARMNAIKAFHLDLGVSDCFLLLQEYHSGLYFKPQQVHDRSDVQE